MNREAVGMIFYNVPTENAPLIKIARKILHLTIKLISAKRTRVRNPKQL